MFSTKAIIKDDKRAMTICMLATASEQDVIAKTDRWVIDAKSLLGIMALAHEGCEITFESEDQKVIDAINDIEG